MVLDQFRSFKVQTLEGAPSNSWDWELCEQRRAWTEKSCVKLADIDRMLQEMDIYEFKK